MSAIPSIQLLGGRPNPQDLLSLWLEHSAALSRDPITSKAVPSYKHFWNTWIKYLQGGRDGSGASPIDWHLVRPENIIGFLQSGPRSRKKNAEVSDITRRRYWRLLERIYGFALMNGWVDSNPAQPIALSYECPPVENPKGAILTPRVWNAALQLTLEMDMDGLVAVRNRALLLSLFHLGLTPQELRLLKTTDLLFTASATTGQPTAIESLQLDGPGPNQRRRMQVPSELAQALARWLALRSMHGPLQNNELLFCSTHGRAMSPTNLLHLVKALLLAASQRVQHQLPPRMGPQIVRNTRLVMWLNDCVPAPQVAIWAGLKNIKGLYHIRDHLNPDIRLTLRHVKDDEPLPVFQGVSSFSVQ